MRKRDLEARITELEEELKVATARADVAEETLQHIARLVYPPKLTRIAGVAPTNTSTGPHYANYTATWS